VDLCHDTYLPDWAAVGERLSRRTRLVVINTPHNPTGVCWPAQDLQTLAVLAEKHGFLVLSDEVYHNSAFAPQGHLCARSIPGLAGRVIVVGSIGKTLLATGWRLGYAIAPAALTSELRKLHQFITFSAPTPLQHAAAALLAAPGIYRAVSTVIRSKRDRFLAGLSDSRFSWQPSQGGYFQLLNYSAISDDGDVCFADYLVRKHRIAGIPLSGFGGGSERSRSLRFCVAKKDETLDRATSILRGV
jgi:methionine aminotransferase